jgi:S-adenosylmethionine-diacylglycerol 3-amino-3-carboxypropyl transferase
MTFYSRLNYSFGNEDWRTEQLALKIQPQDHILCVTASGDRPLNLLVDDCRSILSVDANRTQNYLLHLKMAAMRELDSEAYLAFLGAAPHANRKEAFKRIEHQLDCDTRHFWLKHQKAIAKGVIYQGAMERFVKKVAAAISFFRKEKVNRLFSMQDLEEQRQFVRQQWNSPAWKKTFDICQDPGLFNRDNSSFTLKSYIYDRINASLNRHLARESILLSLLFKGDVSKEGFSPYMMPENIPIIQKRLNRLSTKNADIVSYLESVSEPTFDCFSLSDVASYISKEEFVRLLRGVYRTARPGARFSIRQFLSSREIPDELKPFFVRDKALEKRLEKEDRCFVYRYMVGTISKKG